MVIKMKKINKKIWALTLAFAMMFSVSAMVNQVKADESTPSITFTYDDNATSKQITIAAADSGYYYSNSNSPGDANLIFMKNNLTYYVGSNLTVVTSGPLSTKEIQAGDNIFDFSVGTYSVVWNPTGYVYFTFTVSGDGPTPSIAFTQDTDQRTLTVTSVDPSDVLWSDIMNIGVGVCAMPFVGFVEPGDLIFGCYGTITLKYVPTNTILSSWTFPPEITFVMDDSANTLTVTSVGQLGPSVVWSDIEIDGNCDTSGLGFYVDAGDVITDCYGRITIVYTPTNTVMGIWDFSEEIPQIEYGWIFGTVFVVYGNSTTPLSNATVSYRHLTNESDNVSQFWRVVLTDVNGNYLIELLPDTYELQAGRRRPSSPIEIVEVTLNGSIKLDFILDEGTTGVEGKPAGIVNNTMILDAIQNGSVGGEITIWQNVSNKIEHEVMIYNGVVISNLEAEQENISFIISGDEGSSGKTIAITTDLHIFDITANLVVKYDGEIIKMANSISDVLNPNDDGIHAEYIITIGTDGIEILISIPHFSEHEITISTLQPEGPIDEIVESVGGINAIMLYLSICIVASVLFIGTIYMRRKL